MRLLIFILFFMFFIALGTNVNALSVVSDFLENNTLVINKGESKLYGIRLQNPTDEEANFMLTYDEQIAKIADYKEVYTVAPQTNLPVYFNITTKKLKPGIYVMSYTIHELSGSGTGVPILLKINKNLKVKVDENPEKANRSYLIPIVIAVTLLILVVFRKKVKVLFNKSLMRKQKNN